MGGKLPLGLVSDVRGGSKEKWKGGMQVQNLVFLTLPGRNDILFMLCLVQSCPPAQKHLTLSSLFHCPLDINRKGIGLGLTCIMRFYQPTMKSKRYEFSSFVYLTGGHAQHNHWLRVRYI